MSAPLPFTITAPASSGNLGPGFDVLAMALELRNQLQVRSGSGRVVVRGEGEGTLAADSSNLVARAFEVAAGRDIAAAGIDLRCDNRIPVARGLGSSTAAAACGLIAGWHVAGVDWDEDSLFDALSELDGHPDNAAACAYGGVVLCRDLGTAVDVTPLGRVDWITPVLVVPAREVPTTEARAALPETYARAEVVRAIGAASMLVGGLIGGHPELVADALHADVLHEQYRAALVPELAAVREVVPDTGALGATLSGAGPSVLVWCEPDGAVKAQGSLAIDFPDCEVVTLACADAGAHLA